MEYSELEKATQISLHSVRNILGSPQQLDLFSDAKVKDFSDAYGVPLNNEISRYGVHLSDLQQRVMEAILHGFTKTRYKGNAEPIDKPSHAKEKYPSGEIPNSYQYVATLPKLKVSQSEILKWAGINQKSAGDIQAAVKALKHLGTAQYCFYYTRLAIDEKGEAKRDREGDYQKEEVIAVDTLFTIKEVRSKKTGALDYYEVVPSTIFLDQRESYFMLIPFNWREEVKKLVGERKASSYTFRFLLFLRYSFELIRRSNKGKGKYIIKHSPEEMAIKIKMPESVYKRQKARANATLQEVYAVAKKLGYLKDYERTGYVDILYLDEEKYYLPKYEESLPSLRKEEEDNSLEMKQAIELLNLIIQEKKKIIPTYNPVNGGQVREHSLKNLKDLVKKHSFEDIKKVIVWGISKPFWCNRVGAPVKLCKNFEEAFLEMKVSEGQSKKYNKEEMAEENKELALIISQKIKKLKHKLQVDALNKYIEIGSGLHQPTCINYTENGFRDQLETALKKRDVSLEELLSR